MTVRKKILLAISTCFLGFLVVHFTAVISYVSPREWNNSKVRFWSEYYVNPQFHQGWQVFAPVPREDARLKFRYYTEGVWSGVYDLENEMNELNNPFSDRIAIKSAFYLGVEIRKSTTLNEDGSKNYRVVKASYAYGRSAYACFQHVKRTRSFTPDSMEIILERALFPKPGYVEKKLVTDYLGAEYVK
ncbi:MAG: hypothetical protein AB8B53_08715 [Flavobacteriales bacterium]